MKSDINCDVGEGMPNDAELMPYISSANIACGYHAGDETTMRNTIDLCLKHNVAIGAHPGFNDKGNFGRKPIHLSTDELYQLVWRQLAMMHSVCQEMKAKLHHVKLHGALYTMSAQDASMSRAAAEAVKNFNPDLIYYGLSGSVMIAEAQAIGLKIAHEVFADRTYLPDGSLSPRSLPNAVLTDPAAAVRQAVELVNLNRVTTTAGTALQLRADTLCLHGDEPHAPVLVRAIRAEFNRLGIQVSALP